MLSQGQQDAYIAFVANFVKQLHQAGIERATAERVSSLAAATMLGAVLHILPSDDRRQDDWAATVITVALTKFYGAKNRASQP